MATITDRDWTSTIIKSEVPSIFHVYNKRLYHFIEHYPRTGAARYWLEQYNYLTEFNSKEPTAIHIHLVWQVYVSPAEGGCWDERREPIYNHHDHKDDQIKEVSTICVYNKKQCIRECLALTQHHDLAYQPRIDTTADNVAVDVTLDHGYCQAKYPSPYC